MFAASLLNRRFFTLANTPDDDDEEAQQPADKKSGKGKGKDNDDRPTGGWNGANA